jgi:nicotinic acid mononucleotide adenylyltransferase
LRRLESNYQAPVVFVLGTDQAITLPTWKHADSLLSEFQFLIIQRPGTDANRLDALKASAPDAIYDILHLDLPISSTAYRTTKDARLLDSNVENYITQHDLY